jgi:hypothetical protein
LPYIGPWIAATLPIIISIATSPGWTQPLLVLGWYITVELISNNVVEPLVYGSTTGISTVGVIIAAIFWTWLWGPLGLILAMPMTVSLLVAVRYVPQLRFITILLADQPPMTPAEHVYQRLLGFDYREPMKLAHEHVKNAPLVNYYDEVLLPVLVMAESDRHADLLTDEQSTFVLEAIEDIVQELDDIAGRDAESKQLEEDNANGESGARPAASAGRVLCIPLRDTADEIAANMLVQLLTADGYHADAGRSESLTTEQVDRVAATDSDIVVISVLPPIEPRDSRLLWRRLRSRYPNLPIVVGFWTSVAEKDALAAPVEDSASRVVTKLADGLTVIRGMATQVQLASKTA